MQQTTPWVAFVVSKKSLLTVTAEHLKTVMYFQCTDFAKGRDKSKAFNEAQKAVSSLQKLIFVVQMLVDGTIGMLVRWFSSPACLQPEEEGGSDRPPPFLFPPPSSFLMHG